MSSGSGSFSVEGSTFQGIGNEFFQYSGSTDILLSLAFNIDGRTFDKADSLGGDRVFFQNGVFGGITCMGIDGGNVSISLSAGALSYTYSNTTVGTNLRFSQGIITATRAAAPAVPEPASWAMMITGFGAIGTAMRRRKVAISFA